MQEQRDIEKNGKLRIFPPHQRLALFQVIGKEHHAEHKVHQHAGEDSGVALFIRNQDGSHAEARVKQRHQQRPDNNRAVDKLIPLAYGPEVDRRRHQQLQEHRHHDEGGQLDKRVDLLAENQIKHEENRGDNKRDRLHRRGIGVAVVLILAHTLVENGIVQPEGHHHGKDLQP